MRSHSPARGITLIELLVTITVMGVLLGLAVPSFLQIVRSNRAQAQSSTLFKALNYARSEAVRRGTKVYVTSKNGNDWTTGWHVWADANSDANYKVGTDIELQAQDGFSGDGALTGTLSQLVFSSAGVLSGAPVGADYKFQYQAGSDYCSLARNIYVNFMGRVYIKAEGC